VALLGHRDHVLELAQLHRGSSATGLDRQAEPVTAWRRPSLITGAAGGAMET
jgi:hypothetical protein